MICIKCSGFMVQEYFPDGFGSLREWRCINCGLVLDPVIEKNRLLQGQCQYVTATADMSEAYTEDEAPEVFAQSLVLVEVVGENCTSEADGKLVNHLIEELLNEGHTVKLDFHGVRLVTPSFYRAAVGNLSCTFPEEFLESSFSVVGLSEPSTVN